MKDNRGVTLTEVLTIVSIVSILAVALSFSYIGWMGNYRIESATKDLYADLMEAKMRALTRARVYFVTIDTTQYTIQDDLDPWPDGDAALTGADSTRPAGYGDPIPLLQKTLPNNYELKMISAGALPQTLTINPRGLITPKISFRIDNTINPDYDCFLIDQTRIVMGKYNGTTSVCDPK